MAKTLIATVNKPVDYSFNHVKDAAPTPAGGVVIVGTSNNADATIPGNTDAWFVIKYGPDGQKLWQKIWKRCSTLVPCDAQAYAVAADQNGNIFVSCNGWNTLGTQRFQLEALDASGNFLWKDRRDFSQLDNGYDLLVRTEADAQYLYATEPENNWVHKYQVAGGAHLWDKQFGQRISHIETAPDGENLLLFSKNGGYIYKVDPSGKLIWTYHNPYPSEFKTVDIEADQKRIYVATEFVPTGTDRTHTFIYAIKDQGDKASILWDTIYKSEQLLNLDANIKLEALFGLELNLDLSKTSDMPIAINKNGQQLLVVLNTAQTQAIALPDKNMASVLTLNPNTGAVQHNQTVAKTALYSVAFIEKHSGFVFASGQSKAPTDLPAETEQVTGRFGGTQCGGNLIASVLCILGP